MGSHPINLGFRFILEIAAFISMGLWGWRQGSGFSRYLFAVGIPLLAAVIWGVFNVPGDPSRSGQAPVVVPGFVRLILELVIFGTAIRMLYAVNGLFPSLILGIAVVVHYAVSYDRIMWLLKRK